MTLLQIFFNCMTLGAIYALVAAGIVIVFKATDLINFGAGDWVLGGAYIALALVIGGAPIWLTLILAPVGGVIMGILIDLLVFRRLLSASPWMFVVASLAVGGLLRELAIFRYQSQPFPFPAVFSREPFDVGGILFVPQNLWIVGATLVVFAALMLFFKYARYGKALEAVAQNRTGAQIVGVNLRRSLMVTFGLAGGVSAIAAMLIAPSVDVSPEISVLVVSGFVAAAVGGLDSLGGALVGGFLVALIQTLTTVYISSSLATIIVMLLLLVVMYVRPSGLFGSKVVQRV